MYESSPVPRPLCVLVYMYKCVQVPEEARCAGSPGAGVPAGCKPHSVGGASPFYCCVIPPSLAMFL